MKSLLKLITYILLSIFVINNAHAQDCNPRDFAISDVEKIDFSEATQLSAYSMIDSSRNEASSSNFGLDAIVSGIPVNLSNEEKKSLSEHILQKSGFQFDRQTNLSIVRTALSRAGADMYSTCIGFRNIKVDLSPEAYREDEFFLNVTWTPQYKASYTGHGYLQIINGSVEGQRNLRLEMSPFDVQSIKITKQRGAVVQISIVIDGKSYPDLTIPPAIPLRKFTAVKRRGEALQRKSGVGDECTDQAYLVDEFGSSAVNGMKSCTLCVARSADGFLLNSTAKIDAILSARGANASIETNNALEICARFWTSGAGKGSGRFEVGKGSTLTAWEAVPN